jgi:hypothetical protein
MLRPRLLLPVLLVACSTGHQSAVGLTAPQGVTYFGNPPPKDQRAVTGLSSAPQSYTPPFKFQGAHGALRSMWSTHIGLTDAHTTMVYSAGKVVVGASDGVSVLDAKSGKVLRVLGADRDVGGVALEGDRVFFGTAKGAVVAASLSTGASAWRVTLKGAVPAAPALGDLDGDGALDVVVGDEKGFVTALSGKNGKVLWQRSLGEGPTGSLGVSASVALADLDADGRDDVIAGNGAGTLAALHGLDGAQLWTTSGPSAVRSAPVLVDVDADGKDELLAAWTEARVAILDLRTGKERWGQKLEEDDGTASRILASPLPLAAARRGFVLVPTARGGDTDGLVLLEKHLRVFRAKEGRVTATPVVAELDKDDAPEAIVGTEAGELVAVDALGQRTLLGHLAAPSHASPLLADVDADGLLEILVGTDDGNLACLGLGAPAPALVHRFRGDSPRNTGRIGAVTLGWVPPLPSSQ